MKRERRGGRSFWVGLTRGDRGERRGNVKEEGKGRM